MCNLSRLKTVVTGEKKKILQKKKGSKCLFSMGYLLSSITKVGVRPAVKVLQATPASSLSSGRCRDQDEDEDEDGASSPDCLCGSR